METTNNQISKETIGLLRSLKGKKLNSIIHEPFRFTPTSYGIVYLVINNKTYIFEDYQEPMEYFKAKEDLSRIKFHEHEGEVKSSLEGIEFIKEEVNQTISKNHIDQYGPDCHQQGNWSHISISGHAMHSFHARRRISAFFDKG